MQPKQRAVRIIVWAALAGAWMATVALALWWGRPRVQPPPPLVVIQKIQALSQLATVKYVSEQVFTYEPPPTSGFQELLDRLGLDNTKLVLLAHGEVTAGVDFSRMKTNDIAVAGSKVVLTLPQPEILRAHLIESRTRVLDWKNGLFRGFDMNLEQKARQQALVTIKDAAREGGIEREAAERARAQLRVFLQALGFAEADIRFRER